MSTDKQAQPALKQVLQVEETKEVIEVGHQVRLRDGQLWEIEGWERAFDRPSSTGRIYVREVGDINTNLRGRSFFPNVAGMEIVFIDPATGDEVAQS